MGSDLFGVWLPLCLLELVEKSHEMLATRRLYFPYKRECELL